MARNLRAHLPDQPLHLIARGVERRDIFSNDGDRRYFQLCARESFSKHGVRLLSDCLMDNHFHLLAAPSATPIGVPMHLLQTKYAHYFNHRHGRVGHLFQDRFHSVPVLDLRQLVVVSVYINENPLRAGMVAQPGDWPWSSHREILGGDRGLLDLDQLPSIAGMTREEFVEAYRERVGAAPPTRMRDILVRAAALTGLQPDALAEGGKGMAFTLARRHLVNWGLAAGHKLTELADAVKCSRAALQQLKNVDTKLGSGRR